MDENRSTINWYPGHMAKARRMLEDNLKLIDVVAELVDARAPLASRNPDFDALFAKKTRILLMNKSDLSDPAANKRWIAYYKRRGVETAEIVSTGGNAKAQTVRLIERATAEQVRRAEEKGVKRCTLVLGRTIAGALILLVFYALMFVLMVLLGLVLGAHLSVPQMGELLLKTGTGCAAAVTTFVVCMFFEYLFAFPVISMALYCGLMLGIPCFFELYFGYYADEFYKYATWVSAQCSMNLFYTTALLSYPRWNSFLICLIHIAVFLPLTMLVFRLKKKDKKKRKKKGEEAVDPEIKEILEQAELTEDIVE